MGKALKRLFNAARPPASQKMDAGMPSNHANALSYWLVVVGLHLPAAWPGPLRLGVLLAMVLYTLAVLWARVDRQDHTWPQVAAGCTLGTALALLVGNALAWLA